MSVSLIVHATLTDGGARAQAEAEADESDMARAREIHLAVEREARGVTHRTTRADLNRRLAPGPVRNVLDCLVWDRDAKRAGVRAWDLADANLSPPPESLQICRTIGLADPATMAAAAGVNAEGTLKVKLGDGVDRDIERVAAIRAAAPTAALSVDANEGWTFDDLRRFEAASRGFDIGFIEQPMSAAHDGALIDHRPTIPLCADESFRDRSSLPRVAPLYQWINIKLDKCGGLTEALATVAVARRLGLRIMVGCNVGTSLAMAPAYLVAAQADFVDLDGPMLIDADRAPGMVAENHRLNAPSADLWG